MSLKPTLRTIEHESSAESRSTSAESRHLGRPDAELNLLPEYEYPVPVIVRNTFIDTQDGRSVSLEEFFEERRIRSCPVTKPGDEYQTDAIRTPEPEPLQSSFTTGAQVFMSRFAAATGLWTATPTDSEMDQSFNLPPKMPHVLSLSYALRQPEIGSPEVPTAGSAVHYTGECKPCAFLYTKGCENGAQCTFCHLCPPDEKRRRQKEKQAAFREMRKQRRQVRL
jgi:hypothetical protein